MSKTSYQVTIPVELRRGEPFTIVLKNQTSAQWACIREEYRRGDQICVPRDQFHADKVVPDELRFVWQGGRLEPVGSARAVRPGAIVVVLESPHNHEYGPGFVPLGPLRKKASQTRFRNQLPRLLAAGGAPDDADVVLANPIGLQTSLHRLMQPAFQNGVQGTVRNNVWKALWEAEQQGERPFQADFRRRIEEYRPSLIINACTTGVKERVADLLAPMGYPLATVSDHPSYWDSQTSITQA